MTIANCQRRQTQTLILEALERRELPSAIRHVPRPAAVAPPVQLALFSIPTGDPNLTGTMLGTIRFTTNDHHKIHFSTAGPVQGHPDGTAKCMFEGKANSHKTGETIKFSKGVAELTYPKTTDAPKGGTLILYFTGKQHIRDVTLEGKVFSGEGIFEKPKGNFVAEGDSHFATGSFIVNLKIHLTQL
jgi:hypothetical protein